MKKQMKSLLLFVTVLFFGACGTDNPQQDTATTDTSVEFQNPDVQAENSTMSTEETVAGENSLVENQSALPASLAALETMDWTELTCYADAETSLRNSNLLNYGYLTYDRGEHIYFADVNTGRGGIYISDANGENVEKLSEDSAVYLQLEGGWLYYHGAEAGIKRVHVETGETEWIYQEPCGEFVLANEKIYINAAEGFCRINLDGSEKEILGRSMEIDTTCFTEGNGLWLGNAINDTDASWFWKGYLVGYNEELDKQFFVDEGSLYPLLAGNWLSVLDVETTSRHVWNLETDEMFDLKVYAHRAVSDGNYLYYADRKDSFVTIYRWNGEVSEEIWQVDAVTMEYMYLTPDALYCLPTVVADNKQVQQLWYYDLETGETGIIY